MLEQQKQDMNAKRFEIDIRLVGDQYNSYRFAPENYLLEIIKTNNPWPQYKEEKIIKFLRRICSMYNPIPYHNLTHGFDVMVNMDQFLTNYGWQTKIKVTPHQRIYMLLAAFAHDAGHQGLTNDFYKSTKHKMAEPSQSPLEYLHLSNLRKAIRQNQIQIDRKTLEYMSEMILRTDNYYHHWLLERCAELKNKSDEEMQTPRYALMASCLLLHAADLNNTFKKRDVSVLWTYLLYEEFQFQRRLENERNIKTQLQQCRNIRETASSNIGFLNYLVIPLYTGISELEPRFKEILDKILQNKGHWQAVLNQ